MDAATFQSEALQYERLLYRVSWSMLGNKEDCNDAVQDALMRAWQKRDSLRNLQAFRPWLMRILVNTCNDMLRKYKHVQFVPVEEAQIGYEPNLTPVPFREAMQTLSPQQRTVAMLFYLEGYPIKDIADMLAIPIGTVKSRLMYARKRLQIQLSEEWEG
ncbi:MAG: RNA polymerase sigma factor [Clostridia bacterium]